MRQRINKDATQESNIYYLIVGYSGYYFFQKGANRARYQGQVL
jgi:hypothetical protein